ncbi:MAG: glycosyltransferase [Porticoccaceae bacterium]|nr:glycosyltransferase [Porticoccaceae bacterium]
MADPATSNKQPAPALAQVSIVIPMAADESEYKILEADLHKHSVLKAEIIPCSNSSRAKSLNTGAAQASGEWLWFVHADSRISTDNLCALAQSLEQYPEDLHYFDLAFDQNSDQDSDQNSNKSPLYLNALGANLRSRLCGTPFGDQGFCIKKSLFKQLSGYPEKAPYGEDLLFVWQARQAGIKLRRIPSTLTTSGRKYRQQGWLKLTLLYQWRWITMSLPQLLKLIAIRIRAIYE